MQAALSAQSLCDKLVRTFNSCHAYMSYKYQVVSLPSSSRVFKVGSLVFNPKMHLCNTVLLTHDQLSQLRLANCTQAPSWVI